MSQIIRAEKAGFCFGVERAVNMLEETVSKGKPVYSLGQFIHNTKVTDSFKARGVKFISDDDTPDFDKGSIVFVRAHGAAIQVVDRLRALGAEICDGTCPFVKKIHFILDKLDVGTPVFIFGDPTHPEVIGIRSHAKGQSFVFADSKTASEFFATSHGITHAAAVTQTTFSTTEWAICREIMAQSGIDIKVYDTICSTTEERQTEAQALSRVCDLTVVVGGRQSSNTAKLFAIAQANCKDAIWIDGAEELHAYPAARFGKADKIAITAGASTPSSIIEEVINTMAEIIEEQSFEELLAQSFKTLHTGEKVTGIISMVSPAEIHVDLGTKHTGILPYDEITSESGVDLVAEYHVGDPIEVLCLKFSDSEGTVQLSKKRLDADKNWTNIVSAEEEGTILSGTVREVTKGGVIVVANGTKIFVPASHTGLAKDADMHTLMNKAVKVKIIEINDQRKRAVGSIRNAERIERKKNTDEFYASIEVGQKFTGTVRSITEYGLFVNIGPVEGMVHITELSWGRLKAPSELFKVGDSIDVFVKKIDLERHRISLGYKTEENNPWNIFVAKYNVGDVVDATIVSLMPFGAFAEIIPGVDGLIHNTQIALKPVANPASVLAVGDKVTVKITAIETERTRVSLSIKALLDGGEDETNTPAEEAPAEATEAPAEEQ